MNGHSAPNFKVCLESLSSSSDSIRSARLVCVGFGLLFRICQFKMTERGK